MREMISMSENEKNDEENDIKKNEIFSILPENEMDNYKKMPIIDNNEIIVNDPKKRLKNLFEKFVTPLCFILTYLFYLLSLEACYEGEGPCSFKVGWIKRKLIEELISCILLTIMIQLIILKTITKKHLIHIIIVFIFFYLYSHGMIFEDHGYFNFLYYFMIVGVMTAIMIPFDIMIYCKKTNKSKKLLFIYLGSFTVFALSIYFYFFRYKSSCSDWPKGLNNTYIENDITKHGCLIQYPKQCAFKVLKNIQDYTKLMKKDCVSYNTKTMKETLFQNSKSPYINEATKRVGFPLTNKDPECFHDLSLYKKNPIYEYCLSNLVDMNNQDLLDKYFKDKIPEIEVDFSDDDIGKINIDVKFNKTLSEERKLFENNSEPYSNNILLLYIDSVSRANALRQLKKTMNFFEKFMSYKGGFNEKYPSENFHSFQFFKYHSFIGNTYVNYPFLFYGQKNQNKNKNLLTKFLKENGYVTCNVHDYCEFENTRTHHNFSLVDIFDHQFIVCDPNDDHMNINRIRCLYGKQNMEHFLNYTEQFWRKYNNNRKYASIFTNHGHEGTLNVVKYVDEFIADFFNRLFDDNLLKDTSIIFLSDHGVSMPSMYYIYDFYPIEVSFPSFYVIINDRKNVTYEEQYKFIQENQQKFVTAFDIYNTIGNLIYGNKYVNMPNKTLNEDSFKSELGVSLFNKINSKERFPKKYDKYSAMDLRHCK